MRPQCCPCCKESESALEILKKRYADLYGIHFDFDKAVIQPDSNALLDDIATTLKHFPEWRLSIWRR